MNSIQERDEWIERIKEVVTATTSGNDQNTAVLEEEASVQSSKRPSLTPPLGIVGGLSLLGVTVIKESKLARLQANQPTLLLSQSSAGDESIFNEIALSNELNSAKTKTPDSSSKLISNVFPGKNCTKFSFLLIQLCRRADFLVLSKFKGLQEC
jgi:hypothetical protein